MQLRQAVEALRTSTQQPGLELRFDDGTVCLRIARDGEPVSVSAIYSEADAYPESAVVLWCDSPLHVEALERLAELHFQRRAPLPDLVQRVCQIFGLQLDLAAAGPAAPATPGSAGPARGAAASTAGDDADIEGSNVGSDEDGAGGGSDGGGAQSMDEDDASESVQDDDEDEEREMLYECGKRLGRWERHEAALLADVAEGTVAVTQMSAVQKGAMKLQIFEPREAFSMLSKELLTLLRLQSLDMFVDSVGSDVYRWSVELAAFDPDCALAKDMAEVSRRHSYGTVQLHISFMRGLHPFYPACVEIVRPHFQGPMLSAVASHPMLRLENWDPWRPQADLIQQVKAFLESTARVDLNHPMNDIGLHPTSCYSVTERQLARLEALSGLMPLCHTEFSDMYSARDSYSKDEARLGALLDASKKRTRPEDVAEGAAKAPARATWAAGTGYGSGGRSAGQVEAVWDPRAAEVTQRARDDELHSVLQRLTTAVAADLGGRTGDSDGTKMDVDPPAASTSASTSGVAPGAASSSAAAPGLCSLASAADPAAAAACMCALERSVLVPFIIRELGRTSFTEMCTRGIYYTGLMNLVREVCCAGSAAAALLSHQVDGHSVRSQLNAAQPSAKSYTKVVEPLRAAVRKEEKEMAEAAAQGLAMLPSSSATHAALQEAERSMQLADALFAACAAVEACGPDPSRAATGTRAVDGAGPSSSGARSAGAASSSAPAAVSDYCTALKPLQVGYCSNFKECHSHSGELKKESSGAGSLKPRMMRIAKELSGLESLLPLNESSSVFVRVDEGNVVLWKALITGPDDTPYSGGCFVFDIYFPPTYPATPPLVQLRTTGGGTVRFNPNLYNCGKVCLSLLGTWQGNKGENWSAEVSSLLQVVVSIQSLILVPDPYFNEPGYEGNMNTEAGNVASRDYNKVITEGCLQYAMVDILKHPPKEFADVIRMHFLRRREAILASTQKWVDEARSYSSSHASKLDSLRTQMAKLMKEL